MSPGQVRLERAAALVFARHVVRRAVWRAAGGDPAVFRQMMRERQAGRA